MSTCIVHVGMPKTGSSSIQAYLYYSLADRRFSYIGFGEVNGSRALTLISLENPEQFWIDQRKKIDPKQAAKLKSRYFRHLHRSLERAKQNGKTAILSGEDCWHLQHSDLLRLKQLIAGYGFEISIITYIRPYHSWLESSFQQNVKWGVMRHNPLIPHVDNAEYLQSNYLRNLDRLIDVFGESSLVVRPFQRSQLVRGCAVRDFCAQVGINDQGTDVPCSNEAISLDAIRFLYAYSKFAREWSPPTGRQHKALIRCLQELPGQKLRFHSSVMAPVADRVEHQRRQILERFGIDLGNAQVVNETASNVIQCEHDLYQFTPESLRWLANYSGCQPIHGHGEPAARLVAASMDRLRRRALWTHWRPLARERLRMELNRWRG